MKVLIDFSSEESKRRLYDHLKSLHGKFWVEVQKSTRTTQQNKYYWSVVICLVARETGMDEMEIHEEFKRRFLTGFHRTKSEEIFYARSTAELTTIQFEEYVERCRAYACIDLDIYIPDPNEIS